MGLGPLDGVSHYDSLFLSKDSSEESSEESGERNDVSKRSHILHNIDDFYGYEAVRKGDYKLLKGINNPN